MIDLEVEYNNRARVPEHPQIFARWVREAAHIRSQRQSEWALDIAYGSGERQRYDYLATAGRSAGATLLFIHGGYWQSLGKSTFSQVAHGAGSHGIDVAIAGYTLCPDNTISGIIKEIQKLIAHLAKRSSRPLVVSGHSAGGHLAAVMAASDWAVITPDLGFDPVAAALPISGVFDLEPLIPTSINAKLGLDAREAEAVSPLFMPAPRGKRVVCVVGAKESPEFLRQQRVFVDNWGQRGSAIRGVELEGADHFTVVDPLSDPDSDMTKAIVSLAVI